jgi:DNA primase
MAITLLLQHPKLHQDLGPFDKISTLNLPGIKILVQILETLQQNPHLNTAALLERSRDTDSEKHLQRLAQQTLPLTAIELKHELVAIVQQLQKQAVEQRKEYLERKHPSQLTDEEKAEIRSQYH